MFSGLLFLLCLPLIVRQWQRYSSPEANQAGMLPFADNLQQAKRIEHETGLVCQPDRLALQVRLSA